MLHQVETPQKLLESTIRLRAYIEANNYKGFDPYDALKSPLLNNSLLIKSPRVSFLAQQLIKRTPFNLRSVLGIKKGLNPVTLGLCIQAYAALGRSGIVSIAEVKNINKGLIELLENLIPAGYHGSCWGYDFPWQSRYFRIDAYQPSIVATGIITNALFRYLNLVDDQNAKQLIISSASFVLNDLKKLDRDKNGFCFSYTPFDSYPVYNASMKAVRLLSQAWSLTGNEQFKSAAEEAMCYVMSKQNNDGSWYYSKSNIGKWIDSYHTGYVLDCADDFSRLTGNDSFSKKITDGFRFFENHFIGKGGFPAFYHDKAYPVDCTAAAQVILTLCRFGKTQKATDAALFTIENMQSEQGNFYFRKYKNRLRKDAFMRWSDAWMFAALCELLSARVNESI